MKAGLLAGIYALRCRAPARRRSIAAGVRLAAVRAADLRSQSRRGDRLAGEHAVRSTHLSTQADFALVLESARENGDIVSARKGIADYRLTLPGVPRTRASSPRRAAARSSRLPTRRLPWRRSTAAGPGVTVNVGVVDGGTRPNIVAEQLQLRSMSAALRAKTWRPVSEAIRGDLRAVAGVDCRPRAAHIAWLAADGEDGRARPPWPMRPRSLAGRLGFELRDAATGGASDANTTSGSGARLSMAWVR